MGNPKKDWPDVPEAVRRGTMTMISVLLVASAAAVNSFQAQPQRRTLPKSTFSASSFSSAPDNGGWLCRGRRRGSPGFGPENGGRRPSFVCSSLYGGLGDRSVDDDDDEDDEDARIDPDSLGDWRAFRRNLSLSSSAEDAGPPGADGDSDGIASTSATATAPAAPKRGDDDRQRRRQQHQQSRADNNGGGGKNRRRSIENEAMLRTQSQELAKEYRAGVWAHETATPEVGGLVVRMPLEVEIHRNHMYSVTGKKFRKSNSDVGDDTPPSKWYDKAQTLIEGTMLQIAGQAGGDGQIDADGLDDASAELLQLYLDNQETWQEVNLVLDKSDPHGEAGGGTATALVLNRPMALKLTQNLGRMVFFGTFVTKSRKSGPSPASGAVNIVGARGWSDVFDDDHVDSRNRIRDFSKFMRAFGPECAVYIGGPDDQDMPAEMVHGIADLPGAVEISPGSRIYRGGIPAAVEGVLSGRYSPMEFRFFVGRHNYDESMLDVYVRLGKYQPVACARSLALKQCLSLPKPLWHEVLELCGGELRDVSDLELMKRDDLRFQIIDDEEEDDDDDEYYGERGEFEFTDELDELDRFDDEEEDRRRA